MFGALGEATTAERSLVQELAKAEQEVVPTPSRMHGPARSREEELVRLVGYVCRVLSFTAVHQQARWLQAKKKLLGDGVTKAAKMRKRRAHWPGCVSMPEEDHPEKEIRENKFKTCA